MVVGLLQRAQQRSKQHQYRYSETEPRPQGSVPAAQVP
jgi:hypothetical protein